SQSTTVRSGDARRSSISASASRRPATRASFSGCSGPTGGSGRIAARAAPVAAALAPVTVGIAAVVAAAVVPPGAAPTALASLLAVSMAGRALAPAPDCRVVVSVAVRLPATGLDARRHPRATLSLDAHRA